MIDSKLDIERLRKETPSCENLIHFNNAGASLMPNSVYQALTGHLALERDVGGYEAEALAKPLYDQFYDGFAKLLNVNADEIAYVENATRAWDMAFYSIALKKGDRIITHASEYVSNYLAFLQIANRRGIEIDVAPSDDSGQIDVASLAKLVTPKTKVIAITHVPTQGGLVNPAVEIGQFAKDHGLIYLLDACQSVGQLDVNVAQIGCDLLSGTGRKFLRGPRGTGFLYVSSAILEQLEPPFIDLHTAHWKDKNNYEFVSGARRFENWESYVAGRVGLAAAVQYAMELGLPNIEKRVIGLAALLRERLQEVTGVRVHDQGIKKCGIVTFTKDGEHPSELAKRLNSQGINISVSKREYAQLDFGPRKLPAAARASVHYYNAEEEVDRFCEVVNAI